MLKLTEKAEQFLKDQRYVYEFLAQQLKLEGIQVENKNNDYFVAELITTTDCLQIINSKSGQTQQFSVDFQLQYGKLSCPQDKCNELGIFLKHDFSLRDDTYITFIQEMKHRVDQLCQTEQFQAPNVSSEEKLIPSTEEEKLAVNLIEDALMVEDVNKKDDDTIWTALKKTWPILFCIAFCGASLGICLVNAPLHLQNNLGASGMMVTLYQAAFNFAQLFGSPCCHWLSEKIGYKPVYTGVYACYTVTMFLMSLATRDHISTDGGCLAFLYCMRIIQGFTGISQPLGFSMLSASIAPRLRSYASAMNNVAYYIGGLLGTVINAFIAPAAGWFSEIDDVITFVSSMYICGVLCGLSLIFSIFVKECNPQTLIKRECKKNGVKYHEPQQQKCTWGEAFRIVFTNTNLVLSFVGLILGLGNSESNKNVATMLVRKSMFFYNTMDAQKFISIIVCIAIILCGLFAFTLYQPCQRWFGLMPVVAMSCWLAAVCSILRVTPTPLNQIQTAFSSIVNQFGQILIDAPFIAIVSTYTNTYNKARVMGVYQLSNSLSRSIIVFIAGVLFDWHGRNAQMCYTYFAMAAATVAAFIKQPINIKFA